ncbi:hypothetical protein [Coleofasciculus sp. G2-EDA-02]
MFISFLLSQGDRIISPTLPNLTLTVDQVFAAAQSVRDRYSSNR